MSGRPGELSPRQAAKRLGRQPRTIQLWCRQGRFAYQRKELGPPGRDGARRIVRVWLLRTEIDRLAREEMSNQVQGAQPAQVAQRYTASEGGEGGEGVCEVSDCDKPAAPGRRKCWMHYRRQARGTPMGQAPREVLPPQERIVEAAIELVDSDSDEDAEYDRAKGRVLSAAESWMRERGWTPPGRRVKA